MSKQIDRVIRWIGIYSIIVVFWTVTEGLLTRQITHTIDDTIIGIILTISLEYNLKHLFKGGDNNGE